MFFSLAFKSAALYVRGMKTKKARKIPKTFYLAKPTLAALKAVSKKNRRSAAAQGEIFIEAGISQERNTEEEST